MATRGCRAILVSVLVTLGLPSAAWAVPGHIIVVHAKIGNDRTLLHLVDARTSGIDRTEPRFRLSSPRANLAAAALGPHLRAARLARGRREFRILSDGYLRPKAYAMAVGRLYSVSADGKTVGACTASVVGPDVILTAAHCVHDPESGRDFAGFLFVPGMRGSTTPEGLWIGSASEYWSGFARAPRTSLDYAFVILEPNQSGQSVGDVTGHYRIVEYAHPRRVFTEGYPGTGPFSANCTLASCLATYCYSALGAVLPGRYGNVLGIGCVTGQGSSGGPWFVRFHGQWAIGSVTSIGLRVHHADYFRVIFGPQFDSSLDKLLAAAETG